MPRIYDRTTGESLGYLSDGDCTELMRLFEEPLRDDEVTPLDPELIERLAESGASERLLVVLQQIQQGREDFDLDWEPD